MSRRGNSEDRLVKPAICVISPQGSDTRNYTTTQTSSPRNLMSAQEHIGPDHTPQTINTAPIQPCSNRSPIKRKPKSKDPRAPSLNHRRIGIIDRREILILQSKTRQRHRIVSNNPSRIRASLRIAVHYSRIQARIMERGRWVKSRVC
jgi:hypothetical protein